MLRTSYLKPVRRLDLLEDCLLNIPGVEPLILTTREFKILIKKNPLIAKIVNEGIILKGVKNEYSITLLIKL